ncbi:PREDICTED: RPA-interacting protein isoform X2 [Lupinus angustifolius]|uniref:RPA-interacting protein isoform X2 n=1 Tax=Lupinus angustifolius TaxID=3871 RepID=UPI00092EEA65|nr:PREDICTED: RPA-interacting protein isoform X2 [Lupinus angustifolius]
MNEEGPKTKQNEKNGSRRSLKSDSHFNNYQSWKQKLRDNCFKRVQQDRAHLLWKLRLPSTNSIPNSNHLQDIVSSAFQDIVSDEIKKMKDSPLDNSFNVPISDCEMDDLLWDYDGLHSTYQGECEEIMLEMQRIFYQDLTSKPVIKDLESGFEIWEDEVDEHLAKAVFEHMQLNADKVHGEEIWCPICKQGELKEADKLIYCTCCELQLNKDSELRLDFLRQRLAEVHSEHLDRGCRLKPSFCIKAEFNLTALYISCEGCDTFEVVI